jgi:ubiquinone/menaquinone biosynthesis C-methylase UbiE
MTEIPISRSTSVELGVTVIIRYILYWLCKWKLERDRRKTRITYAQGYEIGSQAYAQRRADFSRIIFEQPAIREKISSGSKILDVGSGRGAGAVGLVEIPEDIEVLLSEPSHAQLVQSRKLFENNNHVSKLKGKVCSVGERLPFASESFDLISSVDVLEHVIHWRPSLAEIYRVLKPNGYAYLQFVFLHNANHSHLGDLIRFKYVDLFWSKESILWVYEKLAKEEILRKDVERPEELAEWFSWHIEQHRNVLNRLSSREFEQEINSIGFSVSYARFTPVSGYIPLLLRPFWPWHDLLTANNVFFLRKKRGKSTNVGKLIRSEARITLNDSIKRKLERFAPNGK